MSETGSPRAKSLHPAADVELARLARALAHPARVRIVRLLARRGEPVTDQRVPADLVRETLEEELHTR